MSNGFRIERRRHRRMRLIPMYSSICAEVADRVHGAAVERHGHVYDVSEGGARIELDGDVNVGASVGLAMHIPGASCPIEVTAEVVRVASDADDPGPCRIAVQFVQFKSAVDQMRLHRCCSGSEMRLAA